MKKLEESDKPNSTHLLSLTENLCNKIITKLYENNKNTEDNLKNKIILTLTFRTFTDFNKEDNCLFNILKTHIKTTLNQKIKIDYITNFFLANYSLK